MVGIEAHLKNMKSLLHFDDEDRAMILGIYGLAGIGKTTIARALHSQISRNFPFSYFMENVSESKIRGSNDHTLKLSLQEQFLSKILNQDGMKINHLGVLPERLHDKKVLIILDDVDDVKQLEALANETAWFGPGSRIIVTTRDQEVLENHNINNTYHVDYPTNDDAHEILCRKAFRQSFAPNGFEKLVERATEICCNLPLALRVIGSTLRGKKEEDWECILRRQEKSLDREIEEVLMVGYDNLHEDEQLLFILIALIFNYQDENHVKAMVADHNSDEGLGYGLKALINKSLVQISTEGKVVMHKLLQQVGTKVVQRQDQGKRQILLDTDQLFDVLQSDSDGGSVMGISIDISKLSRDIYISSTAFKRICKLRFVNIYNSNRKCSHGRVHVPEDMNFPSPLRLLHWENYPGKCLSCPLTSEYLVELDLKFGKFEKLWEGIQPLSNLKKMSLGASFALKELPDLSNASNLEELFLHSCVSLVEIPSSIRYLQKLKHLNMDLCLGLQTVPSDFNLASLESVSMFGCCQLGKFPDIFKNITSLIITDTMLKDLLECVRLWSRLQILKIFGRNSGSIQPILDEKYIQGDLDLEKIPDCFKDLHELQVLQIDGCPKLGSLPELPASLRGLDVINCESLETIMSFPSESTIEYLSFVNCSKLDEEARRVIAQHSGTEWLPGRNVPAEFDHRAIGNCLVIPVGTGGHSFCVVVSPKQPMVEAADLLCRLQGSPDTGGRKEVTIPINLKTPHVYIGHKSCDILVMDLRVEFSTTSKNIDIIECGFKSLKDKTNQERRPQSFISRRGLELFPDLMRNTTNLTITDSMLQDLFECVSHWSRLQILCIYGSSSGRPFPEERWLIRGPDIEKIPDCIKDLHGLQMLQIDGCPKLASLPELPASLTSLFVYDCYSLETLMPFPSESPIQFLYFSNSISPS